MTTNATVLALEPTAFSRLQKSQKLLIGIAAVAAIGYSAFPLAYFCNRSYFWRGLVSGLAEPGQPYNWLFTALDVFGALLGVGLFSYFYYHGKRVSKLYQAILAGAVLACGSELITDIAALPQGYNTNTIPTVHALISQPIVIVHGVASLLNSCAFIVSLGLWVYVARRNKKGNVVRAGLFLVSIGIGSVGSMIGYKYPASSASLQRLFILAYGVWVFTLALYAIQRLPTSNS